MNTLYSLFHLTVTTTGSGRYCVLNPFDNWSNWGSEREMGSAWPAVTVGYSDCWIQSTWEPALGPKVFIPSGSGRPSPGGPVGDWWNNDRGLQIELLPPGTTAPALLGALDIPARAQPLGAGIGQAWLGGIGVGTSHTLMSGINLPLTLLLSLSILITGVIKWGAWGSEQQNNLPKKSGLNSSSGGLQKLEAICFEPDPVLGFGDIVNRTDTETHSDPQWPP